MAVVAVEVVVVVVVEAAAEVVALKLAEVVAEAEAEVETGPLGIGRTRDPDLLCCQNNVGYDACDAYGGSFLSWGSAFGGEVILQTTFP